MAKLRQKWNLAAIGALAIAAEKTENEEVIQGIDSGKDITSALYQEEIKKDPYMILGFGLISYRSMLQTMMACFFFLTCLSYPIGEIYEKGGAMVAKTYFKD